MFNLSSILHRLTAHLPMRIIDLDGDAYLERYHVASLFGRRIWLHHFVRNDSDRHVHAPPWDALSVILTGSYVEVIQTPTNNFDVVEHTAPGMNWIPSGKRHRIISVDPGTWSLMLVGRRQSQGWYFYDTDGKQERRGPSPRNPDWQLTAGTRASEYVDLKVRNRRNAEVKKFFAGRPMPDLSVGYFEEAAHISLEAWQSVKPSKDHPFACGLDFGADESIITMWQATRSAIPHAQRFYRGKRRIFPMSQFEWLTRCQCELARLSKNPEGNWGPNASEAYYMHEALSPEVAAARYLSRHYL